MLAVESLQFMAHISSILLASTIFCYFLEYLFVFACGCRPTNGKMTCVIYSRVSFTNSQNEMMKESAVKQRYVLITFRTSADIPGCMRSFVIYTSVIRREDVSE